ncbi:hypothetical protein WOLCODRAFT_150278 [Wolfiporia cocos MD-104 SS10]|uniref:Uncharacterized protein n=1 Tax=Wolfiporia cocos (strain MD-104) TaxID=742152 RepID=A0A2H3JR65_WOLCO|nr:hypothetical protein WOLCODRAFT_150278 [Wolfiporia cocos MD-104 SS10]
MPPKRKGDNAEFDEPTARERKEQKTAIARTIAVQSGVDPAGGNAIAGPSSKSVRFNSMQGLPNVLSVEKYAEVTLALLNANLSCDYADLA